MSLLEQHVQQLVSDLELPPLPSGSAPGEFVFPVNPEMTVALKELDPGMLVSAVVGPCPKEKKEELFIWLMKANFLGQGTGGGAIGLTEDENFLTLSLKIPYDLSYKLFREAIEDFANYVDFWRDELLRFQNR